jgi:hypothetical protein
MVMSVLVVILFGMDLAIKFPFRGIGAFVSSGFIVSALLLGYLSWSAFREQT